MKGISRIDSKKCRGYLVRVYRNSMAISKLFSDSIYGGKRKALKHAAAYHRKLEAQIPISRRKTPLHPPFRTSATLSKRNRSGVNGVTLMLGREGHRKVIKGYVANYKLQHKVGHKIYLVSSFGSKRAALEAAKAFRARQERKMLAEWNLELARRKYRRTK